MGLRPLDQFETFTFLFYFCSRNVLSQKTHFYLYFEKSHFLYNFQVAEAGGVFGTKSKIYSWNVFFRSIGTQKLGPRYFDYYIRPFENE